MHQTNGRFLAYITDSQGKIVKEVVRPLCIFNGSKPVKTLFDLVDNNYHSRLKELLTEVITNEGTVKRNIPLKNDKEKILVHFLGTTIKDGLLIVGGGSSTGPGYKVFEEMVMINNEQTNKIRELSRKLIDSQSTNQEKHLELYRQFSETNNELINAQRLLAKKNAELEAAIKEIQLLSKMIPICSSCKKIRDDEGFWQNVENYLSERSKIVFSHSICPNCIEKLYPEYAKKKRKNADKQTKPDQDKGS